MVLPFFDLEKRLPLLSPLRFNPKDWNLVRAHSKGDIFGFWGFQFFSRIMPFYNAKNAILLGGFSWYFDLFVASLPIKLSWEVEIWYVDLVL